MGGVEHQRNPEIRKERTTANNVELGIIIHFNYFFNLASPLYHASKYSIYTFSPGDEASTLDVTSSRSKQETKVTIR